MTRYKSEMDTASRIRQAMALSADVKSGAELARRTYVDGKQLKDVTVRSYITGERNPPLHVCLALGKQLRVRGQWLYDGTGTREAPPPAEVKNADPITIVPLIDSVTAGKLATPSTQIPVERVPLLAFADLGSGDFFALRVEGGSMDRLSPNGSIIIVNRRERDLISGKCYVFSIRGETTYKRWQGDNPAYLEPFSTESFHKPIFVTGKRGFEVVGRVKRSVLDL